MQVQLAAKRPLTLEELLADLEGDKDNKAALKSLISKLRKTLPVVSTFPYQITASFRADYLEVIKYIQKGNLKGGPKPLPRTFTQTFRITLYPPDGHYDLLESLRKSILKQQDPELRLQLSAYVDDLELLETTQPLL